MKSTPKIIRCREMKVDRKDMKAFVIIDRHIVADLTTEAKVSSRLRTNLDLRNSPADKSQRLLKAILPSTEENEFVAIINVGYPAKDSQPSPMHGVRKSIKEFVTRIE